MVDDTDSDTLSHRPGPGPARRHWTAPLIAGAVAGVIGWIATFPFDVLKTRLQASTGVSESSWRMAHKMYYAEPGGGGRVFWRGLVPTLVRAVPVNMAVFGTFESVIWAFSTT
jgi:solute carrier family 25 carnitine/acylcarnitine transporter 20/29